MCALRAFRNEDGQIQIGIRLSWTGVLFVFDDFGDTGTARMAFEGAPLMVRRVWLDAGKPHGCAAFAAHRMLDFQAAWIAVRVLHGTPPR